MPWCILTHTPARRAPCYSDERLQEASRKFVVSLVRFSREIVHWQQWADIFDDQTPQEVHLGGGRGEAASAGMIHGAGGACRDGLLGRGGGGRRPRPTPAGDRGETPPGVTVAVTVID